MDASNLQPDPPGPSVATVRESLGVTAGARVAQLAARPLRARFFQVAGGRVRVKERFIELLLFLAGASSILITVGIVGILIYESTAFFEHVSLVDFLTDTQWTPLFEDAHYGILPLLCGTFVTTMVGL